MLTLYNVVSKDGFIATKDGSEDFIPDDSWQDTLETFKKYDVLILGRKSYEAIQKYDPEQVNALSELAIKKYVVTHNVSFTPKTRLRSAAFAR
jgi:dihydrofolate reductase